MLTLAIHPWLAPSESFNQSRTSLLLTGSPLVWVRVRHGFTKIVASYLRKAFQAERARAKRLSDITAHLDTLDDDELDLGLRQFQHATGRLWMGKTNYYGQR